MKPSILKNLIRILLFLSLVETASAQNSFAQSTSAQIWKPKYGPKVLVLNSYHADFSWTRDEMIGIYSVLDNKSILFVEYMDTKRFRYDTMAPHIVAILKEKYQDIKFDVIITTDYNALKFAHENRNSIFLGAPIVFCGIEDLAFDKEKWGEYSGVFEASHWINTVALIKKIQPNVTHAAFIADPLSSDTLDNAIPRIRQMAAKHGIEMDSHVTDESEENLKNFLEKQPQGTVILASVLRDKLAREWLGRRGTVGVIKEISNFPIYSSQMDIVTEGALGGVVKSGMTQGRNAANLAMDLLAGKIKDPIRLNSPKQFIIDYSQLDKHKIKLNDLPKNVEFLNPPDVDKSEIDFLFSAVAILSILILGLSIWVTFSTLKKRRIQKILAFSEARFIELIDKAPVMLGVSDKFGRISYINATLLKYSGYEEHELIGCGWEELVFFSDRKKVISSIENSLKTESAYALEFRIRRYDGKYRWIFSQSVPRFDLSQKFIGYITSCIDIHDRKVMERRLLKNEKNLIQMKECAEVANESKSQFLASVAHELRTPLTAILGFAEILNREILSTETLTQEHLTGRVDVIDRSAKNLLVLVNDLLDLSKIEAGVLQVRKQMTRTSEVLEEVLNSLKVKADRKQITISMTVESQVPAVIFTDPLRLKQILMNLIDNSIKYSDVGQIKIHVSNVSRDENDYLVVTVADEGIGIARDDISKLFLPFSQIANATAHKSIGAGLGLYLTRQLAHALGGSIELVSSTPGSGSLFRLTVCTSATAAPQNIQTGHQNDSTSQDMPESSSLID